MGAGKNDGNTSFPVRPRTYLQSPPDQHQAFKHRAAEQDLAVRQPGYSRTRICSWGGQRVPGTIRQAAATRQPQAIVVGDRGLVVDQDSPTATAPLAVVPVTCWLLQVQRSFGTKMTLSLQHWTCSCCGCTVSVCAVLEVAWRPTRCIRLR